jgi:hypothetical protein
MKLSVLMPVYNEIGTIAEIVKLVGKARAAVAILILSARNSP